MSHARCACPRGGRNDATARGLVLATLLPTWGLFIGGRGCECAHHHADRVTQRQPRTLSRHSTHCTCCLGRPAARRARRWAIRRQVLAAAARRQTCTAGASTTLGTIATPTQQNATLHHATRNRWKAWRRHATGTQRDANAGYATRQRHSRRGNAEPMHRAQSRLREVWATWANDPGKDAHAGQRDWTTRWTAQRPSR